MCLSLANRYGYKCQGDGTKSAFGNSSFIQRRTGCVFLVASVFLGTAVAEVPELSSLLLNMYAGAVLANLHNDTESLIELCNQWTQTLSLLIFVISNAGLAIKAFPSVGVLGIVYIISCTSGDT